MPGILRRTALWSDWKNGVYDSGWRKVVTAQGSMLEPTPYSAYAPGSNTTDFEYGDQITHIDDVEWIDFGSFNKLSGVAGGTQGSADGFVHGGLTLYGDD